MKLVRVGRRFINVDLMRYALIGLSPDTLYVYFSATGTSANEYDTADFLELRGDEALQMIEYLWSQSDKLGSGGE